MAAEEPAGRAAQAQFGTGLVVGKFAPLHRGHELLIESARAACDEVVVISYTRSEFAGCTAARRAAWLAARFPTTRRLVLQATGYVVGDLDPPARAQARALAREMPLDRAAAAEHHAFAAALCRHVLGVRIDAVFGNDPGGAGLAAALPAGSRADEPRYPNVRHVLVDRARTRVPVSARQVRRDVHAHRSYLSPQVYATFVERVCLLGAESSGKTTLARRLAQHFDTTWVREYGRELWQTSGGALQQDDLRRIAEIQVAREEAAAPRARRFLFCDTSPLTALFYSQRWFGRVDPVLRALAARPYDHVVLCAPDFPFVQDGTRQGPRARDRQHGWYAAELARREITPFVARGTRDERVASIAAWLQRLRREAG